VPDGEIAAFRIHRPTTPAIALRDLLVGEGWNDLFLDLDPERGIAAGERWGRALNEAARRCRGLNIGLN